MKKLKFYLQHLDGIWSVPLAFAAFWFAGIFLQVIGGYGAGTYDVGFIQPLFLAAAIVIGATNVAVMGLYFTFRGLYRYLYGQRHPERCHPERCHPEPVEGEDGTKFINYSKINWTKLTPWQRYVIAFSVFFYFASAVIIVYLNLV